LVWMSRRSGLGYSYLFTFGAKIARPTVSKATVAAAALSVIALDAKGVSAGSDLSLSTILFIWKMRQALVFDFYTGRCSKTRRWATYK